MLNRYLTPEVRKAQEFQSAVIRILAWFLMTGLIGAAGLHGIYQFDWRVYGLLFGSHLVWFGLILVHAMWKPKLNRARTYVGVLADMSGTSFVIFLSGNPISPFYLVYIWSFLSQGTRFGRNNLFAASAASIVAFAGIATVLDGWQTHPLEISFMLLFLVVLPLYQYSLLNKLHAAKLAAEAANRARGNFLATMTHELRTPLSGVIGMAGLLNSTRLDDEQREYLESINASARVLQSLIGDILDLSKIDAGKLELKSVRFDVRNTLVETANALSNQALDKGVELICRVDPKAPQLVYGDELRFRQILFNLVGNAVKFTDNGQVCIHAVVQGPDQDLGIRHLLVSVTDTGIGISEHKLNEIFDSFWQADSSTTRRYGGTGLGTTIARDLTHLMGGVIGVESQEGQGSRFWIKLPILDREVLQPPQPPSVLQGRRVLVLEHNAETAAVISEACEAAGMHTLQVSRLEELSTLGQGDSAAPVDVMIVSDSPKGMDLPGMASMIRNALDSRVPVLYLHYARRKVTLTETHAATQTKPFSMVSLWQSLASMIAPGSVAAARADQGVAEQASSDRGVHVLVAEDDSINAKLINSLLAKAGYRVTLVRDGQSAFDLATRENFDVALIDLRMPKMDGIDFTRAYREQEKPGQRLPIIALTANAAEDAKADCMAAGMDEFLTKPVDPQSLEDLLSHYAH